MAVKVYLKGVTVFIDDGTTIKRIPSGYVTYDISQGNIYIHNLIDSSSKTIPLADLQDEGGVAQTPADDYLSTFIGSFEKGGGNGMGLQGSNTLYFDDATYIYISGLSANGDWYVNRNTIANNTQTTATETNNTGQATQPIDLATVQGLTYS